VRLRLPALTISAIGTAGVALSNFPRPAPPGASWATAGAPELSPSGQVTHVGVGLTFGLVVLALIYALGDSSGAHLNPAVTLGFVLARRFPPRWVLPYAASQCGGALLASVCLRLMFPDNAALGGTRPAGPPLQSFALEVVLTLILMFVILSVATGSKEKGVMAGVAVGAVIALEALFAGPICGLAPW
jgi:aquaporin Z